MSECPPDSPSKVRSFQAARDARDKREQARRLDRESQQLGTINELNLELRLSSCYELLSEIQMLRALVFHTLRESDSMIQAGEPDSLRIQEE